MTCECAAPVHGVLAPFRIAESKECSIEEKKEKLFELWDELEEKNGPNDKRKVAIKAELMRKVIISIINKYRIRYKPQELIKLNARRTSRQLFNPHGYGEQLIYPKLDASMCVVPGYSSVEALVKEIFNHPDVKKYIKNLKEVDLDVAVSARRFVNLTGKRPKRSDIELFKKLFLKRLVQWMLNTRGVKKEIKDCREEFEKVEISVNEIIAWAGIRIEENDDRPLLAEFIRKKIGNDPQITIVVWKKKLKEINRKIAKLFGNKHLFLMSTGKKNPGEYISKLTKEGNVSALIQILKDLLNPNKVVKNRLSTAIKQANNLWMRTWMMNQLGRLQMGRDYLDGANNEIEYRLTEAKYKSKSPTEKMFLGFALENLRKMTLKVSLHAVKALGKLKDKRAVPVIISVALQNKSQKKVWMEAVIALGKIGDPQAVSFLKAILWDNNSWLIVQKLAIVALGRIGDKKAVSILKEVAFKWSGGLDVLALKTAARFPDVIYASSFRDRLVKLMKSDDFELRHTATLILAAIKDKRAIPGLNRMLSEYVIILSKKGIDELLQADPSIKKEVTPLLKILYNRTAGIKAHKEIIKLLAAFKDSRSILPLMKLAIREKKLKKLVVAALVAIIEERKEKAVRVFLKLTDYYDKNIRRFAVLVLGFIEPEPAVRKDIIERLIKVLYDPDTWVEREAILALTNLGSLPENKSETIAKLEKALIAKYKKIKTDNESQFRIIKALGLIGTKVVVPFLLTLVKESHQRIRHAAIASLGMLGKRGIKKDFIANKLIAEYKIPGPKGICYIPISKREDRKAMKAKEEVVPRMYTCTYLKKWKIVKALDGIRSRVVAPFLLAVVNEDYFVPDIRYSAIDALGRMGDISILLKLQSRYNALRSKLINELKRSTIFQKNKTPDVQISDLELGRLGDPKVLEKIRKRYLAMKSREQKENPLSMRQESPSRRPFPSDAEIRRIVDWLKEFNHLAVAVQIIKGKNGESKVAKK
jgi:HEAT repeat protein